MGPGDHFAGAFSSHLSRLDPNPAWVLLAGYSGSLSPGVGPGELVLASEVQDPMGNRATPTWLVPNLAKAGCRQHRGPIFAAKSLVAKPREKADLGKQTGALAVDMESFSFGSACSRLGIPWAIVRVVFDSVDDPLHPNMLHWCDERGRDKPAALAWDLMTSPTWWWRIPGWAKRDQVAGKALAKAVDCLIHSLGTNRAN